MKFYDNYPIFKNCSDRLFLRFPLDSSPFTLAQSSVTSNTVTTHFRKNRNHGVILLALRDMYTASVNSLISLCTVHTLPEIYCEVDHPVRQGVSFFTHQQ